MPRFPARTLGPRFDLRAFHERVMSNGIAPVAFFSVGVQPTAASWGSMLYQAQTAMSTEPWLGIFPGLFVFVTVLCCNLLADGLAPPSAR